MRSIASLKLHQWLLVQDKVVFAFKLVCMRMFIFLRTLLRMYVCIYVCVLASLCACQSWASVGRPKSSPRRGEHYVRVLQVPTEHVVVPSTHEALYAPNEQRFVSTARAASAQWYANLWLLEFRPHAAHHASHPSFTVSFTSSWGVLIFA